MPLLVDLIHRNVRLSVSVCLGFLGWCLDEVGFSGFSYFLCHLLDSEQCGINTYCQMMIVIMMLIMSMMIMLMMMTTTTAKTTLSKTTTTKTTTTKKFLSLILSTQFKRLSVVPSSRFYKLNFRRTNHKGNYFQSIGPLGRCFLGDSMWKVPEKHDRLLFWFLTLKVKSIRHFSDKNYFFYFIFYFWPFLDFLMKSQLFENCKSENFQIMFYYSFTV